MLKGKKLYTSQLHSDEARTWFSAAKEAASEVLALKYFLKCSGSEFGSIPRVSESES